ncbi:hypothetical protein CPB84DRAFT_1812352 [Gymnopilus junonius]|uniref:DUF221-domain-containing protein n=1 Tax=Gymnopilus junonius TaxID=109634 RepID=A0A9P5TSL0_GYMJU|nr:hypothetical protein CPB84DRAFT_1812352 [Gymnopilus junonius]
MASIIDGTLANDNSRTLAPAAVGSQVALMSIVSIIYEPKVKYHEGDKPPPRISDSLLGWLPPLVFTKEQELLDKIGLDAVAFLRFLRLLRWLFSGITILTCGILIPINVVYNLRDVKSSDRDILSMLTIRDVSGPFLYAHIVVAYLITFLICFCVDMHWRAMHRLRHTWFRSPEYLQSFYARTLQVRRVPKKFQNDEGLSTIFQSTKVPYPTTSVHIGRKVGRLPELIEYHNQTVKEFEEVLVKYLKDGKIKAKRPMIRVGGTCGLGGTKRDAIDFYTTKLQRTETAIEEYRTQIDTRKAENYGFASMAAVPYAHIVAKMLAGKHPKGTEIQLAPNPKDIIWSNMNTSDVELARKRLLGWVWLTAVCFFNTVPLFIISVLANLNAYSFAFISGVLPPAISGMFGFFLPIIMRWLTKYMGALTHSKLDRAVVARYFTFLIISQLIIFTLIGVIFNSVQQIVIQIGKKASAQEIFDNLHSAFILADFLPVSNLLSIRERAILLMVIFRLRGFLAVFDLAQIINLVWLSFKTHVFGRTPRDIREWTQPPEFQYAIYYHLFMAAVGLVFAPLAPLVALAAAIVFWMSSWVYKYQLMFVYVSKVESGGRIWNVIINRLLFCVVLMQALMILSDYWSSIRFKSFIWISAVPPILIMIIFKIYINKSYLSSFHYFTPTEEEIRLAKVYSERADAKSNRLEKRFGHPALHTELFTPMLHKSMMPLLAQVYSGKIGRDKAKLDEYGGQQMDAQVVPGGIKIAAIDQNDLMYDPALYQRDRGELDWDARSIASTAVMDGTPTMHYNTPSKSMLNVYDKYLAHGPASAASTENIEMAHLDSMEEPLLSPRSMAIQGFASQQSLSSTLAPTLASGSGGYREAPLHRPQDRPYSPSPAYVSTETLNQGPSPISPYQPSGASYTQQESYFQHQRQTSGNMLAASGQSPQIRSPSPGPYNAMQYPPSPQPQQHGRQASSPMNGTPPYSHARQTSGNMLANPRSQSPGPYQAYSQQGYSPQGYPQQQQQHARQTSGNMLGGNRTQSPGPYQAYAQPPTQSATPTPYQQHQQQSSNNGNMAGRGAHRVQ